MANCHLFPRPQRHGRVEAPLRRRTIAAAVLLALAPAAAQAQAVPTPMEKPSIAGEDVEAAAPPTSCLRDLETAGVAVAAAAAMDSSGLCIIVDPVAIEAVETHSGTVRFPGRPVVACRFATVLAAWLREVVSPVAASLLGSPVDAVVTGPGYQCRERAGGRLSEHATGNAVDISEIRLGDGRGIPLESLVDAAGAEREFLKAMTASACGYFTTVLGPGSDAAHSDHLHIDLAMRRTIEFRICMAR